MIRLLYFSQTTQPASSEAVENILQSSRANNLALDITGVLVHGGGLFMQRDKVKSGVWPFCSMMHQAASFC